MQLSVLPGLTFIIIRFSERLADIICNDVHRADVECDPFSVVIVGDIGKTTKVETVFILVEQQLIANGNKGCALASQSNIERAEIASHREPGFRSNCGSRAYLECYSV